MMWPCYFALRVVEVGSPFFIAKFSVPQRAKSWRFGLTKCQALKATIDEMTQRSCVCQKDGQAMSQWISRFTCLRHINIGRIKIKHCISS
jgi:hypothetical protein